MRSHQQARCWRWSQILFQRFFRLWWFRYAAPIRLKYVKWSKKMSPIIEMAIYIFILLIFPCRILWLSFDWIWIISETEGMITNYNMTVWHFGPCVTFWPCLCDISGQNVTQAGPKCHTSRAKMSHKGQNVTQSCYNCRIKTGSGGVCCHNALGLVRTVRQIPPATPSGFDFLFRTRPRALWQQTPPEPVLILQLKNVILGFISPLSFDYHKILHRVLQSSLC